jgi:PilZ domain
MEHRWGQRNAAHQLVRLVTVGGIVAHGHILNASVSGAFIQTPLPARSLSIVRLTFVGENRRSCGFPTVAAQVVRVTAEGLGMEWCPEMPEVVKVLGTVFASQGCVADEPSAPAFESVGSKHKS